MRAGYAEESAAGTAWRLLHEPLVGQAIRKAQHERSERLRLSIDRIAQEHARIALSDMGRLVTFTKKGPRLRPARRIAPDDSAAVREVVRRRDGFQVKLYEKSRSLDVLTKMLGVVERYQTDSNDAARERARLDAISQKFLAIVDTIRDDLGIDRERQWSAFEVVAEGYARGDEVSTKLAQKVGWAPKPAPPDDE